MGRILPVLAFLVAAGVIGAAIFELDTRSDDGQLAVPTLAPALSPSAAGPTLPPTRTPRVTAQALASPRRTAAATAPATKASTPEPSFSRTPKPQPTPRVTPTPPRTPTPSPKPTLPVAPIDKSKGPTPHTGANPVPAGVAIALGSLALRALIGRRRRSY